MKGSMMKSQVSVCIQMNKLLILPLFFLTMCGTAPVTPPAEACSLPLDGSPANCPKDFPILKLGKYKGGLIIEERPNRENPFGLLAKRTIGLLRESNPIGIERAYNKTLSGKDGWQLKQRISKNFLRNVDSELNVIPKSGNDIVTTINIDIQDVTENALKTDL